MKLNVCKEVYDIAILGGCITGITSALLLQQYGLKVILVESHNIGLQTSGRYNSLLNSFFEKSYHRITTTMGKEKALTFSKGINDAINDIKKNINTFNIDCNYTPFPAYLFSLDAKYNDHFHNVLEGCRNMGLRVSYEDSIPCKIPVAIASHIENQYILNNVSYIKGLAQQFKKSGGEITEQTKVLRIDNEKTISIIQTSKGKIEAKKIIFTPRATRLINFIPLRFIPHKYFCIVSKLISPLPEAIAYELGEACHNYITVQHNGNSFVTVCGQDHKVEKNLDTNCQFELLEKKIRKHFNIEEIYFKWSNLHYNTPDNIPYIGRIKDYPHYYIAAGFNTADITFGTLSAKIITDLIIKRKNVFEQFFSLQRQAKIIS